MRVIKLVMATAAAAGVFALTASPSAAGGSATVEWGWWWRAQALPVAAPAPGPPVVPEKGMWVSRQSISAIRFAIPAGQRPVKVTLEIGRAAGSAEEVVACQSKTKWKPAQAGAWADRPERACERFQSAPKREERKGADGVTVPVLVYDVKGHPAGPVLDLVLALTETANPSTSVTFRAPTAASVTLEPLAAAAATGTAALPPPAPPAPSDRVAAWSLDAGPPPVVAPGGSVVRSTPVTMPAAVAPRVAALVPASSEHSTAGQRTPLAILPALAVALTWLWRARAAATSTLRGSIAAVSP